MFIRELVKMILSSLIMIFSIKFIFSTLIIISYIKKLFLTLIITIFNILKLFLNYTKIKYYLPIFLYYYNSLINENIVDESVTTNFLIDEYYKINQNQLIESAKYNQSESVKILEKGISDIKFDQFNLLDPKYEDTKNHINLVEKKANGPNDGIILILTATLICVVTVSFYLINT